METIAVVNYGGSNLRSVVKAIETMASSKQKVLVTSDADVIENADRVVFPGQGAIGDCMQCLADNNLISAIKLSADTRPFLGICLGLQSLVTHSDEDGGTDCLALLEGNVRRFPKDPPPAADGSPQKIPHMGWNEVRWMRDHPLTEGIPSGTRFYFVHSYYVVPKDQSAALARTDYIEQFVSAIAFKQAFATQFHPEKSAAQGLQLLKNFLTWDGSI